MERDQRERGREQVAAWVVAAVAVAEGVVWVASDWARVVTVCVLAVVKERRISRACPAPR